MLDVVVRGLKTAQDLAEFAKKLEPGDILVASPQVSKAPGIVRRTFDRAFGAASQFVQNSDKTHSLIYAGNGKIVEARIGLGTKLVPIKKALKGLSVTAVRPSHVDAAGRAAAARRAMQMVKEKPTYAMKGLLKAVLHDSGVSGAFGNVDGVICSDLITKAYDAPLTEKPKDAVLPVDFLRSTKLFEVGSYKPIAKAVR